MTTRTEYRIDHVALMTSDIDAAVDWYVTHLGLAVVDRWSAPEAAMAWAHLTDGARAIELVQREDLTPRPARPAGLHHIAFAVDDCAGAVAELCHAGAQQLTPPAYFERHDIDWAFVADPFGNTIELLSYRLGSPPDPQE